MTNRTRSNGSKQAERTKATKPTDVAKYERHIEKIESELSESREIIQEQADVLAEIEQFGELEYTDKEISQIRLGLQFVGMCQETMDGQHLCRQDGCVIRRRKLVPEEHAAFTAACDMFSRIFDGALQVESKRSMEAGE